MNTMPDTCGKAPMALGVLLVAASSASSSSAPVTSSTDTSLPKGNTVFISIMVMSPASMVARMPPPLVMAATTFSPIASRAAQRMASAAKSPRLVSCVRLPGSRSPLRRTSVLAKGADSSSRTALSRTATSACTSSSSLALRTAL
ncbi:hypothetical protein SDC9_158296 [bioreactor metagenome]|uniref:Uncharacterized protein n=1 Tax=bioreactor metagenome TaxID=1076179 RepID=A0A645F9E9_9ZZZZ